MGGALTGVHPPTAGVQDLPAWVFHGRKDPVVPFDDSVKMVEALRQAGATHVKFTEYEDTAHDAWTGA